MYLLQNPYLYRAVDSAGNTLEFMLSEVQWQAAVRFFRKVLKAQHTRAPRVITVDAAYPVAIETLKADETISRD